MYTVFSNIEISPQHQFSVQTSNHMKVTNPKIVSHMCVLSVTQQVLFVLVKDSSGLAECTCLSVMIG